MLHNPAARGMAGARDRALNERRIGPIRHRMEHPPPIAPEASPTARRLAERALRRFERFARVEAGSGLALLAATAAALAWANSPWAGSYERLWSAPIAVGFGVHAARAPLRVVVDEGLMTIFFLVAGLEIRRELHEGELARPRQVVLPMVAALGGMLAPALVYAAVARGSMAHTGWGIPMATDVAFAVGALALLGRRMPAGARVLLLGLAIIDDLGAIVVIALFYSRGVGVAGLLLAGAGLAAVIGLQRLGVRRATVYLVPGGVVWWGLWRAGVHPTLAGVLLGLATPARPWFGARGFVAATAQALDEVRARLSGGATARGLEEPLRRVAHAHRETLAPAERLQTTLHPWVAWGVMPLFALANAGVSVRGWPTGGATSLVFAGVALGLVVGKPLGVVAAAAAAIRLGICRLPDGVGWRHLAVVGGVAGIGFTMSLFIAGLAFADGPRLWAAKLAVLSASGVGAAGWLAAGRLLLPRPPR